MSFALHQSFHIRDGWLRKGLVEIAKDPLLFTDIEAPYRLGLGKNMVEALRFWLPATGLTQSYRAKGKFLQELSTFGKLVLENDPFLEDDATLWLIHYNLLRNPEGATSWYWFFNHFGRLTFNRQQFVDELEKWNILRGGKETAKSSYEKDFDCLIRTYLPREHSISPEDTQESPLVDLRLLSVTSTTQEKVKNYTFSRPNPRSIPPLVLIYIIKRWQEEQQAGAIQVSFRDMLTKPASPGRTFLLGMRLAEAIRWASDKAPDYAIRFVRTAGLDVLTLPQLGSTEILEQHYLTTVVNRPTTFIRI